MVKITNKTDYHINDLQKHITESILLHKPATVIGEVIIEEGEVEGEVHIICVPLKNIIRLRRITGYLSSLANFSEAKFAEASDRVPHSIGNTEVLFAKKAK